MNLDKEMLSLHFLSQHRYYVYAHVKDVHLCICIFFFFEGGGGEGVILCLPVLIFFH